MPELPTDFELPDEADEADAAEQHMAVADERRRRLPLTAAPRAPAGPGVTVRYPNRGSARS